ncbi:MAG: hypothetical protein U0529_19205 [Thermoanaerobaculia bacterium]
MRHLLVSSADDDLVEGLRLLLPPGTVLLSARGVDDTLERLARSARVDAVVTDDPEVEAAIREEIPGGVPVVVVDAADRAEDAVVAVAAALDGS